MYFGPSVRAPLSLSPPASFSVLPSFSLSLPFLPPSSLPAIFDHYAYGPLRRNARSLSYGERDARIHTHTCVPYKHTSARAREKGKKFESPSLAIAALHDHSNRPRCHAILLSTRAIIELPGERGKLIPEKFRARGPYRVTLTTA